MTRDEAVDTFHKITYPATYNTAPSHGQRQRDKVWAEKAIDGMAALGVLKLDEPKSAMDTVFEIVRRHAGTSQAVHIVNAMKRANLRIVEQV